MGFFDFLTGGSHDHDPNAGRPALEEQPVPTGPGHSRVERPTGFGGAMQTLGDLGRGIWQEGLGFFRDPDGAFERQDAQRALAANFEVVDNDVGLDLQGAPNRVTQNQFQDIARQYASIKNGNGGIRMNDVTHVEDADQRNRDLMGQLGRILQTGSGRRLIDGLGAYNNGNEVDITPEIANGKLVTDNASAAPRSWAGATDRGRGTSVDLHYNPHVGNYDTGKEDWALMRGDVVLFHELTHAYHELHGSMDTSLVEEPGLHGSHKDEQANIKRYEHQAVGLGLDEHSALPTENNYRRERALLGADGRRGVVSGDAEMKLRANYVTTH